MWSVFYTPKVTTLSGLVCVLYPPGLVWSGLCFIPPWSWSGRSVCVLYPRGLIWSVCVLYPRGLVWSMFYTPVVWSGLCFIPQWSGLVWSGLVWSVFGERAKRAKPHTNWSKWKIAIFICYTYVTQNAHALTHAHEIAIIFVKLEVETLL